MAAKISDLPELKERGELDNEGGWLDGWIV